MVNFVKRLHLEEEVLLKLHSRCGRILVIYRRVRGEAEEPANEIGLVRPLIELHDLEDVAVVNELAQVALHGNVELVGGLHALQHHFLDATRLLLILNVEQVSCLSRQISVLGFIHWRVRIWYFADFANGRRLANGGEHGHS